MVDTGVCNLLNWFQESLDEGRQELEIFISGGAYEFKKAALDIRKMIEAGEGAYMSRVNVQIDDGAQYTVYIPKKLM